MWFLRFWRRGRRGGNGEEQRSQQAQKQARLLRLRSLLTRLKSWLAGHLLRETERRRVVTLRLGVRRALALPVYAIALILDFASDALGKLAAWIAETTGPGNCAKAMEPSLLSVLQHSMVPPFHWGFFDAFYQGNFCRHRCCGLRLYFDRTKRFGIDDPGCAPRR
jgi:hypothetical protein